jgi:polysaccharide pyruvyl transferase WcaK-like protein
LHAGGFSVRFFPLGKGDADGCREVARAAGLADEAVDPLMPNADALLDYLERFDVVLSMRLHGAVLAAAGGVPFVALEYQPKVRDFTESIGWGEYTLRTDTVTGAEVERTVSSLYCDVSAARARLDERVRLLAAEFRAYARRTEDYLLGS